MRTLDERFQSFERLSSKYNDIERMKFALAGLFLLDATQDVITTCYSCGKSLSDWEPNDIPFDEHLKRHLDCAILQCNSIQHRRKTFKKTKIDKEAERKLKKNGFFYYPLKIDTEDVFCYLCGYHLNQFKDDLDEKLLIHSQKCEFKKRFTLIAIDHCIFNTESLFFLKLLAGDYARQNLNILRSKDIHITNEQKKIIYELLSYKNLNNPFERTEDILKQCAAIVSNKMIKEMEKDVDDVKILNKVDE